MKKFIVRIGYDDYAFDNEADAVAILGLAHRAIRVDQESYSEPYRPTPEVAPFASTVTLAYVAEAAEVEPTASIAVEKTDLDQTIPF